MDGDFVSRTRQSGAFVPTRWTYFSNTVPNGQSGTGFSTGEARVMHDVVVKNFRKRSEAGEVIMSPMTSSVQNKYVSGTPGSGFKQGVANSYWYYTGIDTQWALGVGPGISLLGRVPVLFSGSTTDSLVREASTSCQSNRFRGSTNNWENLAEVEKTVQLMRHPISSWFRFNRQMKAGRNAVKLGQSAANGYLVWRYGVKPLISSVEDVIAAVEKAKREKITRTTARGFASSSMSSASSFTIGDSATGLFSGYQNTFEECTVRATSLDTVLEQEGRTFGFASKDLMTLPWELIPYSFVVDWFANVGAYFGSLANGFYPAALGSCYTVAYNQVATRANTSHTGTTYVPTVPMICAAHETCLTKFRTVGLPAAGLVVKSNLRFDEPARIADTVALIAQQALGLLNRNYRSLTRPVNYSRYTE